MKYKSISLNGTDNYQYSLVKYEDKYKDILLDIIDYLRDDKDWNFDSLIIDYTYFIDNYLHLF